MMMPRPLARMAARFSKCFGRGRSGSRRHLGYLATAVPSTPHIIGEPHENHVRNASHRLRAGRAHRIQYAEPQATAGHPGTAAAIDEAQASTQYLRMLMDVGAPHLVRRPLADDALVAAIWPAANARTPGVAAPGVRFLETRQETQGMHSIAQRKIHGQPLRAGERALMRWYPDTPLKFIQRVRVRRPHYPLLDGDRGRVSV